MASADEATLIRRAAAGEADAFRALFEAHHEAVFRVAYRLTNAREAAEDITQDCFLRLMSDQSNFDSARGSLRQFLYGMARNFALQFWQTRGRTVSLSDDLLDDPPASVAPLDDAIVSGEIAEAVHAAVSTLPLLQREVIVLFELEELSLEEVAAVLGSSIGTVKSRLHRARERLRRSLGPFGEAPISPNKGASHESSE